MCSKYRCQTKIALAAKYALTTKALRSVFKRRKLFGRIISGKII